MKRGPIRLVLVSTCFLFGMQAKTQTVTTVKEILPNAALFYDYDADGNKEFFLRPTERPVVFKSDTLWDDYYNSNYTIRTITTLCSDGNGYTILRDRLALPGCDLNSDGRIDLLSFGMRHVENGAVLDGPASDGTGEIISAKKYINYRLPDGNYKTEQMVIK